MSVTIIVKCEPCSARERRKLHEGDSETSPRCGACGGPMLIERAFFTTTNERPSRGVRPAERDDFLEH